MPDKYTGETLILKLRLALLFALFLTFPLLALAQSPSEELTPQNAASMVQIARIQQPNRWQMLGLAWSPDGAHLAMSTSLGVDTTDFTAEGMQAGKHYGNTFVKCVAWSPDGKLLAACNSQDGTVFIWNTATGEQAAAVYTGTYAAEEVEFSPDGTLLATRNGVNVDDEVVLWGIWSNGKRQPFTTANAYKVQKLVTLAIGVPAIDMSFNVDGSLLATISASDDMLRIWDTISEELVDSRQLADVYAVDYSPDGRYLAISINFSDVVILDSATLEDVRTIINDYRDQPVDDLKFSPNSALIVASTNDRVVQVWDVESGKLLNSPMGHPHIVWRLAFNPSGKILATLGWNDGIRLWGLGSEIPLLEPPTATPAPTATATPIPILEASGNAHVHTTNGDVLNMRGSPSRQGERIAQLENDASVSILEGPQEADGLIWWKIRTEDGLEGWVVEAVDGEQTLIPD